MTEGRKYRPEDVEDSAIKQFLENQNRLRKEVDSGSNGEDSKSTDVEIPIKWESQVRIAKSNAKTEAMKISNMDLVKKINGIDIVPDEVGTSEDKSQMTLGDFRKEYLLGDF